MCGTRWRPGRTTRSTRCAGWRRRTRPWTRRWPGPGTRSVARRRPGPSSIRRCSPPGPRSGRRPTTSRPTGARSAARPVPGWPRRSGGGSGPGSCRPRTRGGRWPRHSRRTRWPGRRWPWPNRTYAASVPRRAPGGMGGMGGGGGGMGGAVLGGIILGGLFGGGRGGGHGRRPRRRVRRRPVRWLRGRAGQLRRRRNPGAPGRWRPLLKRPAEQDHSVNRLDFQGAVP